MTTDTTITIEEIVAVIKLADSYLDELCSQEGIAGNEPCEFNWARESLDDAIGYLNDYLEENQKKRRKTMNKDRRQRITEIHAKLTELQEQLAELMEEESNALDNLPESL